MRRGGSLSVVGACGLSAVWGCVPDATLRQDVGDASTDSGPDEGPDTSSPDDTSPIADGALEGESPPVTCMGNRCLAGQSCSGGACTFPCSGVHVPGDYSTVQSAIDAVSVRGGTICVGGGTFAEANHISTNKTVVIQGVSASESIIGTTSFIILDSSDVTLRGVTIPDLEVSSQTSPGVYNVSVVACTVGDVSGNHFLALELAVSGGDLTVTLDGVDLSSHETGGGNVGAVEIVKGYSDAQASLDLVVRNCYLHDSQAGVDYEANGTTMPTAVTLVNDTFMRNGTAIRVAASGPVILGYDNNLIAYNAVGVDLPTPPFHAGHNALFGNTTADYAGVDGGIGDILADPMLDPSVPPGLLPGSPCRGAGDPTRAPATDFWGRARGASPDIGAVQSSP
jgi:hypothetical protein